MDAVKVLKAVWPVGIPVEEYGRVVSALERLASTPAPRPTPPVAAPKPKDDTRKALRRQRWLNSKIASDATLEGVRSLLALQPATIKQMADAMRMSAASVNWCVHKLKCVKAGSLPPKSPGRVASVIWRLP